MIRQYLFKCQECGTIHSYYINENAVKNVESKNKCICGGKLSLIELEKQKSNKIFNNKCLDDRALNRKKYMSQEYLDKINGIMSRTGGKKYDGTSF